MKGAGVPLRETVILLMEGVVPTEADAPRQEEEVGRLKSRPWGCWQRVVTPCRWPTGGQPGRLDEVLQPSRAEAELSAAGGTRVAGRRVGVEHRIRVRCERLPA